MERNSQKIYQEMTDVYLIVANNYFSFIKTFCFNFHPNHTSELEFHLDTCHMFAPTINSISFEFSSIRNWTARFNSIMLIKISKCMMYTQITERFGYSTTLILWNWTSCSCIQKMRMDIRIFKFSHFDQANRVTLDKYKKYIFSFTYRYYWHRMTPANAMCKVVCI